MSTPLLLEVAPKIDTNPTSFFYRGQGQNAVSVHPTYFDLATPLVPKCPGSRTEVSRPMVRTIPALGLNCPSAEVSGV